MTNKPKQTNEKDLYYLACKVCGADDRCEHTATMLKKTKKEFIKKEVNKLIGEVNSLSWFTATQASDLPDTFVATEELNKISDKFVALIDSEVKSERERIAKEVERGLEIASRDLKNLDGKVERVTYDYLKLYLSHLTDSKK